MNLVITAAAPTARACSGLAEGRHGCRDLGWRRGSEYRHGAGDIRNTPCINVTLAGRLSGPGITSEIVERSSHV